MKIFRKTVRVGAISIPTGFESSSNSDKLSLSWNGVLMLIGAAFAPKVLSFFATAGIIMTQEQAVALEILVAVTLYGIVRKLFMQFAKVELPAVNSDIPTV